MDKLTPGERVALMAIQGGSVTIQDIADRAGVTTRTINRMIKRLKVRGLIETGPQRGSTPSERTVTAKGKAALDGF